MVKPLQVLAAVRCHDPVVSCTGVNYTCNCWVADYIMATMLRWSTGLLLNITMHLPTWVLCICPLCPRVCQAEIDCSPPITF